MIEHLAASFVVGYGIGSTVGLIYIGIMELRAWRQRRSVKR